MYRIISILILSLFAFLPGQAQQEIPRLIPRNDSMAFVNLQEVLVGGKKRNARYYDRREKKNTRMIHNVKKALPYAKTAAVKIIEIENRLLTASSEKERKKIISEEYDALMKTFKKPLMQLTTTQGKILVRLIYRETRKTSFNHIRNYKGGANAYFWQTLALLFGNNLKADYEADGKDYEIEMIVREIEAGRL